MHVGALAIFEGPPPPYTEVLDTLRGRLHLVPRYRQKLAVPPARHRPPAVGRRPELQPRVPRAPHGAAGAGLRGAAAAAGRAHLLPAARPLQAAVGDLDGRGPRGRPLRAHHQDPPRADRRDRGCRHRPVLFDLGPVPVEVPHPEEAWEPARTPSGAQVLASGTLDLLRTGVRTAAAAASLATRPVEALRSARVAVEGLGEVAWAGLNPAPPTPLNVEIGPHRRFRVVRNELADFKAVKDVFGGTVNDVVLTVVSGALRSWLQLARRAHRGRRAARARARLDPQPGRARYHGQPDRRHARPAPGLRRGPDRAPADGQGGHGRPEGIQAGASAPRCWPASRTSRHRRSSRRPRA